MKTDIDYQALARKIVAFIGFLLFVVGFLLGYVVGRGF